MYCRWRLRCLSDNSQLLYRSGAVALWIVINTAGYTKCSCIWATSELFAMTFSIVTTRIYDTPRYVKRHSIVLAFNVISWVSIVFYAPWTRYLNRKRDRIQTEYDVSWRCSYNAQRLRNVTLEDLQAHHKSFILVYSLKT